MKSEMFSLWTWSESSLRQFLYLCWYEANAASLAPILMILCPISIMVYALESSYQLLETGKCFRCFIRILFCPCQHLPSFFIPHPYPNILLAVIRTRYNDWLSQQWRIWKLVCRRITTPSCCPYLSRTDWIVNAPRIDQSDPVFDISNMLVVALPPVATSWPHHSISSCRH